MKDGRNNENAGQREARCMVCGKPAGEDGKDVIVTPTACLCMECLDFFNFCFATGFGIDSPVAGHHNSEGCGDAKEAQAQQSGASKAEDYFEEGDDICDDDFEEDSEYDPEVSEVEAKVTEILKKQQKKFREKDAPASIAETGDKNKTESSTIDAKALLKKKRREKLAAVPKPSEIKAFLDEYVIGQDNAKKILSVAVYNHYKRIYADTDTEIQKSNIVLVGPTGSGKTYLVQTLAKKLDVPFAIYDATSLTQAGYVGEDVENILLKLIQAADYDIYKASCGIVYIDECDKLGRKGENVSITRDVSGEGVQQALLKIIEGTVANVPPQGGRKHPNQDCIQIDTSNILFICGGAFEGIDDIVNARTKKDKQSVGFRATVGSDSEKSAEPLDILTEDLIKYGIIPEFAGRFPVIANVEALKEEDLVRILTEPKNALVKQYSSLLGIDGVKLTVTEAALRYIARKAMACKTGARSLRTVMEKSLLNTMYELPGKQGVSECILDVENGALAVTCQGDASAAMSVSLPETA